MPLQSCVLIQQIFILTNKKSVSEFIINWHKNHVRSNSFSSTEGAFFQLFYTFASFQIYSCQTHRFCSQAVKITVARNRASSRKVFSLRFAELFPPVVGVRRRDERVFSQRLHNYRRNVTRPSDRAGNRCERGNAYSLTIRRQVLTFTEA